MHTTPFIDCRCRFPSVDRQIISLHEAGHLLHSKSMVITIKFDRSKVRSTITDLL